METLGSRLTNIIHAKEEQANKAQEETIAKELTKVQREKECVAKHIKQVKAHITNKILNGKEPTGYKIEHNNPIVRNLRGHNCVGKFAVDTLHTEYINENFFQWAEESGLLGKLVYCWNTNSNTSWYEFQVVPVPL